MEEKLGRVFKRFVAFMCAFVVFVFGVCLTSFHSQAADYTFTYNCAEPTCTEGQGYLVLLVHDGNQYSTRLYSFFSSTVNSTGAYMPTSEAISIYNNSVNFNMLANSAAVSGFHAVYGIDKSGNMSVVGASGSEDIQVNLGINIVSWQVYGNGYIASEMQNSSVNWSVNFKGGDLANKYIVDIYNSLHDFIISNGSDFYTVVDRLEILESYLWDISEDSDQSRVELENIQENTYEILDYMTVISDQLYGLEGYLQDICWSYLPDIYDRLDSIDDRLVESNSWLKKIWDSIQEFLGLESDEDMESLPDEEVGSVLEDESDLMQDTTDAENSLDFSVDSDSNNVVWNIIERVLNSNSKVFGAFIGIMTLGVITLLLNR